MKALKSKIFWLSLLSSIVLTNCGDSDNLTSNLAVTTSEVKEDVLSYEGSIKSILANNCASCHNAWPHLDWQNYQHVVASKDLIIRYAVKKEENPMPPIYAPAMSEADRKILEQWFNEGMLEKAGN